MTWTRSQKSPWKGKGNDWGRQLVQLKLIKSRSTWKMMTTPTYHIVAAQLNIAKVSISLWISPLLNSILWTRSEGFKPIPVVLNTSNLTKDKENVRLCQGTFAHFIITFFPNFFYSSIFVFKHISVHFTFCVTILYLTKLYSQGKETYQCQQVFLFWCITFLLHFV